jgi:hypothetical protein
MSAVAPSDRAIAHVRARAEEAQEQARARIAELLARAGEPLSAAAALSTFIREHARVTLNFHPDRLVANGDTVAEGLLRDGVYRSQFVTRISNGSRTGFPGGDRDGWEKNLFGGAYHVPVIETDERPKYGALDLMQHADGGSPRFGSCYFILRPHMKGRCTFTWGDSHEGPEHVGTVAVLEPILAAMLGVAEASGEVLGIPAMTIAGLLRRLTPQEALAPRDPARTPAGRALDDYIEAQVHGSIVLSSDAEALVVDPAFEETETGHTLRELCDKSGLRLQHHHGFLLTPSEVPADFRGPRMVPLAQRVADRYAIARGTIDAACLGRAAEALHRDPSSWDDWAPYEETLQHIKQLWHVLVRFGRPRPRFFERKQ